MPSDLLRFDKSTGKLFLQSSDGRQQIVTSAETNKTVFVLVDASGSMAVNNKFQGAKNGALDFGLMCIKKRYEVGVIVFSTKASATSPTADPTALRAKINNLRHAGGSTYLASALNHALEYKPAYVLVVTDGMVADSAESLAIAVRLKASGTEVLTIGTDDADETFLADLASRADLSIKVAAADLAHAISDTSRLLR